ncbi:MAG: hypothetical protein CSA11_00140 [Chloroflexi bacterium]|nr:MAG: hypothetical protein CSA11_00140 [Chloroflexota bacterium]
MSTLTEKKSGLKGWSTRDLLVTAVIGIIFGLLTAPLHLLVTSVEMFASPIASRIVVGVFFIPGFMVPYIIRRPGSAILGTIILCLVQVPINPYGWGVLAMIITNGVPMEIAFLVTRYKKFSYAMMMITGALVIIPGYTAHAVSFGYANLPPVVVIVGGLVAIVSTAVLGGALAKALADQIAQTGVLNSFAIGQANQEEI